MQKRAWFFDLVFPLFPCCAGFWAPFPWQSCSYPRPCPLPSCYGLVLSAGSHGVGLLVFFIWNDSPIAVKTTHFTFDTVVSTQSLLVILCSVITWLNFFEPQFVHLWSCSSSSDNSEEEFSSPRISPRDQYLSQERPKGFWDCGLVTSRLRHNHKHITGRKPLFLEGHRHQ